MNKGPLIIGTVGHGKTYAALDYPTHKVGYSSKLADFPYFVEYSWYCYLIKWREGIAREGLLEDE